MSPNSKPRGVCLVAALVCLSTLATLPVFATPAPIIGQVATNDVRLDGTPVPAGTTLFSGSTVATNDRVGVLHLANGRAVALDKNSRAVLADGGNGDVRLALEEGRASYDGTGGEPVMVLARRTVLILDQEEPGEGGKRMVDLCTLGSDGKWAKVSYPSSQVDGRLALGDVYPGPNNEIGLDKDCEEEKDGYWAGLPPAGKAAWVLAGAAAIVLGDEILEDDPASP